MAFLGFFSLDDVNWMTLREYQLRWEAYQMARVERQEELALQAWMAQAVQATTGGKKPKPKYKKFAQFFDRDQLMADVRKTFEGERVHVHQPVKVTRAEVFARRMEEFQRLKKAGKIANLSRKE